MVKLVLFDIDGTLVHTGGAGRNAFARTLAAAFNSHAGVHMVSFAGRTDVSLVRELFGVHGIPATPENFQKFFDHYAFCLDHVMQQAAGDACDGARDFINDLLVLPNPPMFGLLTGNIRLGAEIKLRSHGLWEIFATGEFADDHEERDQIAAAARARGSRLLGRQLRGEEIVVIGDTPFDIRCGKFIGAKVLAVATGGSTLAELKRHQPDWAVENLNQVNIREVLR